MTLSEFLLQRFAEDEAVARSSLVGFQSEHLSELCWDAYAMPHAGPHCWTMTGVGVKDDEMGHRIEAMFPADADHIARHDPARVLAECEAKRRIVRLHHRVNPSTCATCWRHASVGNSGPTAWPCPTLRALALPYADHPDYREEWKP